MQAPNKHVGHAVRLTVQVPRHLATALLAIGDEVTHLYMTKQTHEKLLCDRSRQQTVDTPDFKVPLYASSFHVHIEHAETYYMVTISRKALKEDIADPMAGARPLYLGGVYHLIEWAELFERDVLHLHLDVEHHDLAVPDLPRFDLSDWNW